MKKIYAFQPPDIYTQLPEKNPLGFSVMRLTIHVPYPVRDQLMKAAGRIIRTRKKGKGYSVKKNKAFRVSGVELPPSPISQFKVKFQSYTSELPGGITHLAKGLLEEINGTKAEQVV